MYIYMFYEYIKEIDNTDKFIYISIIVTGIFIATRLGLNGMITGPGLMGLVCSVILVYYINEKREHRGDTFIKEMTKVLDSEIMKPERNRYLGQNSELVIFLDDHREYYQYNPALWRQFVRSIDNFLHVISDIQIGTLKYNLDYDQLKELKKKILNHYHSFIHKVPHIESSNNKFHEGIARLQKILNTEIDLIHRLVVSKNSEEINTSTAFHYKNHPVGYEDHSVSENTHTFFNL